MALASLREMEYFPEARAIADELPSCSSATDVVGLVHRVFQRFFTAPYDAGPLERYEESGQQIWAMSLEFKGLVPQRESAAITELRRRASSGDKAACLELGAALCNGDGVLRNINEGR